MNSLPTMKFKLLFIIGLYVFICLPVHGMQVFGLYQTSVPVSDALALTQKSAIKQALIQVLIKLTGDLNIGKSSGIASLIGRADRFVQQFRYQDGSLLWVQFDEAALNNALRTHGLNIWGRERPSILVWLAYELNEDRRLANFEDTPEYFTMLDKPATARGISLLFPLLDLEDTSRISADDIWGGFEEPILVASNRYQADVLMAGRLVQISSALWECRWLIYIGDQSMRWTNRGELVDIVLEEGVNELVDRLAAQYANTSSTRTEIIELLVANINRLDDYAYVLAYLESLQSVSSVQVKRVMRDSVAFELFSHSGINAINQSIALGKILEPLAGGEQLNYRLLER